MNKTWHSITTGSLAIPSSEPLNICFSNLRKNYFTFSLLLISASTENWSFYKNTFRVIISIQCRGVYFWELHPRGGGGYHYWRFGEKKQQNVSFFILFPGKKIVFKREGVGDFSRKYTPLIQMSESVNLYTGSTQRFY